VFISRPFFKNRALQKRVMIMAEYAQFLFAGNAQVVVLTVSASLLSLNSTMPRGATEPDNSASGSFPRLPVSFLFCCQLCFRLNERFIDYVAIGDVPGALPAFQDPPEGRERIGTTVTNHPG
jgi:hypothetical protein